MPRYLFSLQLAGDTLEDTDGLECADPDEAWERARTIAQHVMKTAFERAPNWAQCFVAVKDDASEVILELPFVEAIEVSASTN